MKMTESYRTRIEGIPRDGEIVVEDGGEIGAKISIQKSGKFGSDEVEITGNPDGIQVSLGEAFLNTYVQRARIEERDIPYSAVFIEHPRATNIGLRVEAVDSHGREIDQIDAPENAVFRVRVYNRGEGEEVFLPILYFDPDGKMLEGKTTGRSLELQGWKFLKHNI